MINFKRHILGIVIALGSVTSLQAQTYNDTVRTSTWAVYAQGGASYWRGMRGSDVYPCRKPLTPDFALGLNYNIRPWVRIGLKAEYTIIKTTSNNIDLGTTTKEGYMVGDRVTTLNISANRIQNRHNMSVAMADLHAEFNLMDMWHYRNAQKFNLWVGTGIGFWHAWDRNSQSTAYKEEAVANGDTYFNVYTHNYLTSTETNTKMQALYVPVSIALEYDLTSRWTVGLFAEGKLLPMKKDLTPKGIAMAGVRMAFNFVGKKMKTNKQLYYGALREHEITLKTYNEEKKALMNELDSVKKVNVQLNEELKQLRQAYKKLKVAKSGHTVYFQEARSVLTELEQMRLDDYIEECKRSGNPISLVGEASVDGTATKNQKLSEARLKTIVKYLKSRGVSSAAIADTKAIGASLKGGPNHRRVVLNMQ